MLIIRVGILESSCKLQSKIFAGGMCEVAIVTYEVARGELPGLAWGWCSYTLGLQSCLETAMSIVYRKQVWILGYKVHVGYGNYVHVWSLG